MRLSTWDPFAEIEAAFNRSQSSMAGASKKTAEKTGWHPVVDVSESEHAFHLHAELAGVEKDKIKISVHENVLTLSGERQRKEDEGSAKLHRIERIYGSFSRQFTLPKSVGAENVNARYQDGVLEISIPKVEKPQPIDISIN